MTDPKAGGLQAAIDALLDHVLGPRPEASERLPARDADATQPALRSASSAARALRADVRSDSDAAGPPSRYSNRKLLQDYDDDGGGDYDDENEVDDGDR